MKLKIMALGALCAAFFAACAYNNPSINDTQIGIRNVDLLDEKDVAIKDVNYTKEPAGTSKRFDRSFENAPPLISHDNEGLLPITKDMNMCVTCHMPEFAKDSGATAIPASHLYDIRNKKDLAGKLHDERYVCTTCHVEQQNGVTQLVGNKFKPDFRDKNGSRKSNLLDVLNDGVR